MNGHQKIWVVFLLCGRRCMTAVPESVEFSSPDPSMTRRPAPEEPFRPRTLRLRRLPRMAPGRPRHTRTLIVPTLPKGTKC
jgi:hypothetical protein